MSTEEWAVILGGIAAIAWINWYFFLARPALSNAATNQEGIQEIAIVVEGGYQPAVVRVKRDRPVRLVFERRERSGCSEEVAFPDFGIRKFLPAFRKTTIELTPAQTGNFEFTCGMSMLRGQLIVQD
ncbi:MAG: cupredoxin domain-containing protein [Nitrospirota bacterium]|nr:cupredoxin domain-containing protein [Nitrospirota bacterium]